MKKVIILLLVAALCVGIFAGCAPASNQETTPATTEATVQEFVPQGKESLNGKKVIFFGNSFTYYGKCVLSRGQSVVSQVERSNDQGYFYRICKENGVDVSVTNFTFGGHRLWDFHSGTCAADRGHNGYDHTQDLIDRNYDYVILQDTALLDPGVDELVTDVKAMMKLFTDVNPDTKFVFLVDHYEYTHNTKWLASLKELEKMGIAIVDWGKLVYDVISGTTQVPGATMEYNQNSFIVSQSVKDGYHQNMLTGYITALMTYCAITGEKAEGQTYWFGDDDAKFGNSAIMAYIVEFYKDGSTTNFDKAFASEPDMVGFQKLIDQYMAEKAYKNY